MVVQEEYIPKWKYHKAQGLHVWQWGSSTIEVILFGYLLSSAQLDVYLIHDLPSILI